MHLVPQSLIWSTYIGMSLLKIDQGDPVVLFSAFCNLALAYPVRRFVLA